MIPNLFLVLWKYCAPTCQAPSIRVQDPIGCCIDAYLLHENPRFVVIERRCPILNISCQGKVVMLYPHSAILRATKAITLSSMLLPLLLIPALSISSAHFSTAGATGGDDDDKADDTGVVVYSVWVENATGGNPDVFFARSDDGGQNFGDPINMSHNDDWSTLPKIAVAGNHIHVVWLDSHRELEEEERGVVTVRSSDDGGETFDDAVIVSEREVGQPYSRLNILQIHATTSDDDEDDSNVYISWVASPGGQYAGRLNFARSDDSGESFDLMTGLVRGVDNIEMEVVASGNDDSDNIYIAGQASSENDITLTHQVFFLKSTDGGKTFDDPIILEDVDPDEGESVRFESMELDDDQIQATWLSGDENQQTHFAVSTDGGETWG